MFGSMTDWLAYHLMHHQYADKLLPRSGLDHPMISPYGAFRVRGGGQLLISVQNEREWERFAGHVLGKPELVAHELFGSNEKRVENQQALDAEIDEVFSALEREELEARLRKHQIAYGAINSVPEVAAHPALRLVEVSTPSGPVNVVAPPVQIAGRPPRVGPVPGLGEHTAAIRAEFAQ